MVEGERKQTNRKLTKKVKKQLSLSKMHCDHWSGEILVQDQISSFIATPIRRARVRAMEVRTDDQRCQ